MGKLKEILQKREKRWMVRQDKDTQRDKEITHECKRHWTKAAIRELYKK